MIRTFTAAMLAATLVSGNCRAGCNGSKQDPSANSISIPRQIVAAALTCGDDSLTSRAAVFRAGDFQQSDVALIAIIALLHVAAPTEQQARLSETPRGKSRSIL